MAAAAEQPHRFHHDALVTSNRPHAGRFADDRRAGSRPAHFRQCPRALHGSFLVGGGENDQRFAEIPIEQRADRFDGDGEETFHVGNAESVETAVALAQAQRIGAPESFVVRYGVGMAGEYDSAGSAAVSRDEIELAVARPGRRRRHFAGEAKLFKPFRQIVDDGPVAHVDSGIA